MYLNAQQKKLFSRMVAVRGGGPCFKRADITDVAEELGVDPYLGYKLLKLMPKVSHGVYDFSGVIECLGDGDSAVFPYRSSDVDVQPEVKVAPTVVAPSSEVKMTSQFKSEDESSSFVPEVDPYFVKWGNFADLERIVSSGMFYPTFLTGLSGNGKTLMVEQVCAKLGRKMIRMQVTPETDEGDLIGSFQLIDGNTVFVDGPVITAMENGLILLVDEVDRGSNKLLAIQGVLEGKPVLIKKTGRVVKPVKGFNVIATANTKGKGSDDGQFIAANIMDEAFLERFAITIEQPYPSATIETRIVLKTMQKFGNPNADLAQALTSWSEGIRKLYEDGGIDDIISTRRLCHIVQTDAIFNDPKKSVQLCVNRFDVDTKEAFISLFDKIYAVKSVSSREDDSSDVDDSETEDALLARFTTPVNRAGAGFNSNNVPF